jgi:hypothetical protein
VANQYVKKTYEGACSKKCIDIKLDYIAISIPLPFIKSVFLRCPTNELREEQLKEYAQRHGFKEDLVIKKAKDIYKERVA